MAASDFSNVVRPPAPASYSAPDISGLLMQGIGSLPQAAFEGTQRERQLKLQQAFPNGPPKNPDGSINYQKMFDVALSLGGIDASAMAALGQMALKQSLAAGDQPPWQVPAAAASAADGAAASGGGAPSMGLPQQRQGYLGYGGGDQGSGTVASMVADTFGEREAGPLIGRYSAALKVDPNAPLTEPQQARLTDLMQRTVATLRRAGAAPRGATEVAQPAETTSAAEMNGNAAYQPVSGVSGSPGGGQSSFSDRFAAATDGGGITDVGRGLPPGPAFAPMLDRETGRPG